MHVHDYATIRALLRDPLRVTADVTESVSAEDRERLHPVSAFVWATDRRTMSGCPGRHGALRPGVVDDRGEDLTHPLAGLAVGGEVVLAAQPVVPDPGGVRH